MAVANYIAIIRYCDLITKTLDISEPQLKKNIRDQNQQKNISGAYVTFPGYQFRKRLGEPKREELQQQFDQYKSYAPEKTEENPHGFGYSLPDRIKIEYLMIDLEQTRMGIEARHGQKGILERKKLEQTYWEQDKPTYLRQYKARQNRSENVAEETNVNDTEDERNARLEWDALERLEAIGIPTVPAVAMGEKFRMKFRERQSFLLTAELPGGTSLEKQLAADIVLSCNKRIELARRTGYLARRLHTAGLVHRDFYLGHIYAVGDLNGRYRLHLLDLQRVKTGAALYNRWSVKDMTALTTLLPAGANLDAVSYFTRGRIYFSLDANTRISSTLYADEDILLWNGTAISMAWDGSANGLPDEANLDALDVVSEAPLAFSFSLDISAR